MSITVLVKTYQASGRPNSFKVVDSRNKATIDLLVKGYRYSRPSTDKPDNYTVDQAWEEYAQTNKQGYTQWKS